MRNPKFKSIAPNYRKRVLEVTLHEGKRTTPYSLPFGVFKGRKIDAEHRLRSIEIDRDLGAQGATLILADGTTFDFPADLVLYYCDPDYNWSPVNQLKKTLKERLRASRLSIRVMADALNTSPSQVVRLFEENQASKQLTQLLRLAALAGYEVEFQLKKKSAA